MGTVSYMPPNVRTVNNALTQVNQMARRYGASERIRLDARDRARHLMEEGASSAWAIQAARQDLREPSRASMGDGPRAA